MLARVRVSIAGGQSRRSAAKVFGVSAATAIRWVDQWRRSGSVAPEAQGGENRSHRIEAYAQEILALIDGVPDITLAEIVAHLDERHGLKVAQSTVWRLLDRRGLPFRKTAHASEQERPDILRRLRPVQRWVERYHFGKTTTVRHFAIL